MTIPKITVITISYNSSATIEETLKSVTTQDYKNMEYVVIDGGSTDGTQSIIDRYREHISFYVSEPDRGISDAFNKGIAHSTGDLIVCINSDDQLLPGALEKVAAYYDEETDIYSCDLLLLDTRTGEKRIQHPSTHFPLMPFFRRPGHQGVFVTRKAYERLGGYNTTPQLTSPSCPSSAGQGIRACSSPERHTNGWAATTRRCTIQWTSTCSCEPPLQA